MNAPSDALVVLIPVLQTISGVLWLGPGCYLAPRAWRSWKRSASRGDMLSAPVCFFAFTQFGFSARWLVWPHSVAIMAASELVAWSALYASSAFLAVWMMVSAFQTRGD